MLVAAVESRVLKPQEYSLPPQGMIVEITLKKKSEKEPISTVKIDIDELMKKIIVSNIMHEDEILKKHPKPEFLPKINNRHSIRVGNCPAGHVQRGEFCFPDDDY